MILIGSGTLAQLIAFWICLTHILWKCYNTLCIWWTLLASTIKLYERLIWQHTLMTISCPSIRLNECSKRSQVLWLWNMTCVSLVVPLSWACTWILINVHTVGHLVIKQMDDLDDNLQWFQLDQYSSTFMLHLRLLQRCTISKRDLLRYWTISGHTMCNWLLGVIVDWTDISFGTGHGMTDCYVLLYWLIDIFIAVSDNHFLFTLAVILDMMLLYDCVVCSPTT